MMDTKKHCLLLLAFILLTGGVFEGAFGQDVEPGVTNLISLYSALYDAILGGTQLFGSSSSVTERFIITMPGKVLNPVDYDPGLAFESELKDPTVPQPEVNIPLYIKENIFRLADALPHYNPWEGMSKRSFLDSYTEVLKEMDTVPYVDLSNEIIQNYQDAMDILTEKHSDPDALFVRDVSLLDLYNRYKVQFYQKEIAVSELVAEKRATLQFPEYDEWAQVNIPGLMAEVEAARNKWLVYGEKEHVEAYIGYLDVSGPETEQLEDARVKLSAALIRSSSGSDLITRVNMQPPLWHKYLYPKNSPLTKEQIATQIGYIEGSIESQVALYEQSVDIADIQYHIAHLHNDLEAARQQLQDDVDELNYLRLKCRQQHDEHISHHEVSVEQDFCAKYIPQEEKTRKSQEIFTMAYILLERSILQYDDPAELKCHKDHINYLTTEVSKLHHKQRHAPTFHSVTTLDQIQLTDQERADGWIYFEFDTTNYNNIVDENTATYSTAFELGEMAGLWTDQGEAIFKSSDSLATKLLFNNDVRIQAKLLKVNIDRRYFTDDLFVDTNYRNLMMKSDRYVSPAPQPELDFIKTIAAQEYLLPEYNTGFVLAKDIKIYFIGTDPTVVNQLLHQTAISYTSGHYGPFSLQVSLNYENIESYTQATSTADGIFLSIPGTQVIGYTTKVVPNFPAIIST